MVCGSAHHHTASPLHCSAWCKEVCGPLSASAAVVGSRARSEGCGRERGGVVNGGGMEWGGHRDAAQVPPEIRAASLLQEFVQDARYHNTTVPQYLPCQQRQQSAPSSFPRPRTRERITFIFLVNFPRCDQKALKSGRKGVPLSVDRSLSLLSLPGLDLSDISSMQGQPSGRISPLIHSLRGVWECSPFREQSSHLE